RPASDFGINCKDLEGWFRDDGFWSHPVAWAEISDRQRHETLVETVEQRKAVGVHTEVGRARPGCRFVRWVDANLIGPQLCQRLEHDRRTAPRVFVLMETQPIVQLGRLLVLHHDSRTSTD